MRGTKLERFERETSTCIAFLISSSMGEIFSTTVVYVKFELYRACRRSFCPMSIMYNAFLNPLSSIRSLLPVIKTNMYKVLITTRQFFFVLNYEIYILTGRDKFLRTVLETDILTNLNGEWEGKHGKNGGTRDCEVDSSFEVWRE